MGKIWDWHKKVWNDPTPIIQFQFIDDGEGHNDFKLQLGQSKLRITKGFIPENKKQIDCD